MSRSALLISTAVGLTLATGGPVQGLVRKLSHDGSLKHVNAQHAPNAPARPARPAQPSRGGLKMGSTFIFQSDQTVTLPGGFALDSQTKINCKTACVVEVQAQMNVMSYYTDNAVALCPVIDGYFTNGSCYFQGSIPVPGFHAVTLLTSQGAGSGTHLAAMYLYTFAPAYLGSRQTDYHVYR